MDGKVGGFWNKMFIGIVGSKLHDSYLFLLPP